MQEIPNATMPLFTMSATVPLITPGGPVQIGYTVDTFGFIVALVGLAIPMIFYLVWTAVGVAVLIYLRRLLRSS
jgi:hypothetical protein